MAFPLMLALGGSLWQNLSQRPQQLASPLAGIMLTHRRSAFILRSIPTGALSDRRDTW